MPDLIYLIACPVAMGLMMLMMMRGNHGSGAQSDEVAQLRAEVEGLRAQRSGAPNPANKAPTAP